MAGHRTNLVKASHSRGKVNLAGVDGALDREDWTGLLGLDGTTVVTGLLYCPVSDRGRPRAGRHDPARAPCALCLAQVAYCTIAPLCHTCLLVGR